MATEYKDFKESVVADVIETGEKNGFFKVSGKKIEYLTVKKSYNITDPEEWVRVSFYYELIKKYQYPEERIDLEVIVPRREPTDKADIVVYEDDEKKKPYIVVECKKDGISQAEIKQAIEQAFGNANSLRSKYTILVAGNVRIAFDIANFPPEEREKNIIADIPIRYGKVIKFKYKKGDTQWDLRDVTRDELLAKFQQCHDALWEGGKRNPAEAFDEMSKLMYCKIQDERFLTQKGQYYKFQVGTYETINDVAERIRNIYKDAQNIDPEVFVESIKADNPIIYAVAEILQGISLARTDLDVKGEGYEHFLGGVFRGAMGQYFTPRPIVSFMIDFLEPNIDDFLIDPACGSGGFLIYTLERMRKELFEKLDEKDAAYRWQDFALKQVYGIEINSQLARVSMMNMIIHEDGHTNIENSDALDNPEKWKRQKISEYFGKKFTLLLTNPPFGASIKDREKAYLVKYELGGKVKKRNRQNTEILFIERCLDLLKPSGRIGIVLPDGILTNSSLQYVRNFINERSQILGVISLPQAAFRRPASKGSGDTGSGVKASLLFLRKKKEGEKDKDYPIFMAIAEHIGYDSTGRPDKDEFPDILKAWQDFKKTNSIDGEKTKIFSTPLNVVYGGRLDPFHYQPKFVLHEKALSSCKYPLKTIGDILSSPIVNGLDARKFVEVGTKYLRVGNIKPDEIDETDIKFVNIPIETIKKDIKLETGDVLLTRKGTFGISTVVTNVKDYIISSEIMLIRLKEKINPFYFSIVNNTSIVQEQYKQKAVGAIMGSLSQEVLKTVKIPIPPRTTQDRIVKEFHKKREKAKNLRDEAKELLDKAKREVEELIEGRR
jgi:type I restriction enzyme M protein